jgi:hypothetical protein
MAHLVTTARSMLPVLPRAEENWVTTLDQKPQADGSQLRLQFGYLQNV